MTAKMVTLHTSSAFFGFSSFHTKYRIIPSSGDKQILPMQIPAFSSPLNPIAALDDDDSVVGSRFAPQLPHL